MSDPFETVVYYRCPVETGLPKDWAVSMKLK